MQDEMKELCLVYKRDSLLGIINMLIVVANTA